MWDLWSEPDNNIPLCETDKQYRYIFIILRLLLSSFLREYDRIKEELSKADSRRIKQLTDCLKPCKYRQYHFTGESAPTTFKSEFPTFSLWAVSKETLVKTEHLVYPLSSFVADFGGTLSLFLGFSFISLWDSIHLIKTIFIVCK